MSGFRTLKEESFELKHMLGIHALTLEPEIQFYLSDWIVSGYKEQLPKPNSEIGYAISNGFTGRGYATEAALALKNFIFEETETTELVATAMVSNISSNKVLKKMGYVFEKIQFIDGADYNCYRMKKDA